MGTVVTASVPGCYYDETSAIGRRYRRQVEIGTPHCVTIDFDTLGEGGAKLADTVTIRRRDSMSSRVDELMSWCRD